MKPAALPAPRGMCYRLAMLERRIYAALLFLVAAVVIGTTGYMVIERWSLLDSLWMVAITLTTTGYGEVHELSHGGRIFTMGLLVIGMSIVVYGLSMITAFVAEGGLAEILRRRRMTQMLEAMRDHTIVCGAGRTGIHVVEELRKTKSPFVVIEGKPEMAQRLRQAGDAVVEGDATHEDTLRQARIETASRLVACLTDDKDNLFVVLTARGMNAGLRIVARYVDDKSADKLRKAGANAAVSPNAIGGLRMASEALRPAVVSFLDVMLRSSKATLRVEEATIHAGSKLADHPLRDADIAAQTGLLVLATRSDAGEYYFNPPPATPLAAGQTLIVMGEIEGVKKLKALAGENG